MKKLALIIGSAFTFCVFAGLLLFAMFTNTYGIDIDHSGLFPKLEISVENEVISLDGYSAHWANSTDDDKAYTIINNTGDDLFINQYGGQYPNYEGNSDFSVFASGALIKVNGTTIILDPVPDDYQYYFAKGILLSSEEPVVNLRVDEYADLEQDESDNLPDYEFVTLTTTIKDGESYEIKLS